MIAAMTTTPSFDTSDKIVLQIPANTIIEITTKLEDVEQGLSFVKSELVQIQEKMSDLGEELETLKGKVKRKGLFGFLKRG
jgi:hypothetical protein|nr:MAG TPA: hypothetical protein [Caudoviricetes sp.]